jgi:N-acetylglutamate synthase-like GNAT family acetyltransferase
MTCCVRRTSPGTQDALRPLEAEALPALADALRAAGLPADDLAEPGRRFFTWRDAAGALHGHGGWERHGTSVLLRSILIPAEARGQGHGRRLVEALLAEAWAEDAEDAWLLTNGAAPFFARLGFIATPRDLAPPAIAGTRQFAGLCPASATLMRRSRLAALPVAVIGAGPVGLAAAAQLLARGLEPLVLEAGAEVGAAMRAWGHVRMFSPWGFNTDAAARTLLAAEGWTAPDPDAFPTGADLVERYLAPLAATAALRGRIRTGARVIGVARQDFGRLRDGEGRNAAPFLLHVETEGGVEAIAARAVIDCSGTWHAPNPAGSHGLPAPGEAAAADRIAYAIPDVLGADRAAHAGRTTLVVGAGHSAMNAVLELVELSRTEPGTRILWAFRRPLDAVNFGGGARDALAQRGVLGARAQALVESGAVTALAPFLIDRIAEADGALAISGRQDGRATTVRADRMIVATGFRPDLSFLREIRVELDPAVEATPALAPLIDPNLHSCGTVRPHGEAELRHPEHGFWIAGMKSYGRAPTFLLATGHEQVRSIAAFLAGDVEAARRVELVLPETGVCSTDRTPNAASSCGTPTTPQGVRCDAKPELTDETPCCEPAVAPVQATGGSCG